MSLSAGQRESSIVYPFFWHFGCKKWSRCNFDRHHSIWIDSSLLCVIFSGTGQPIGLATQPIYPGEYVQIYNMVSSQQRGNM